MNKVNINITVWRVAFVWDFEKLMFNFKNTVQYGN
jgi:hypothetical protein